MKTQKMIGAVFVTIFLIILSTCSAEVTGPYFGQTPPGRTPQLFAPHVLDQPGVVIAVTRIAFSPDGNDCFFSGILDAGGQSGTRMFYTQRINDVWTPVELAPFFPGTSCRQPFFSADGQRFYFSSNQNGNADIWEVQRTPEGWGTPERLGEPVNSSDYDGMYTETMDGMIYIESMRPGGRGSIDVWRIDPEEPNQIENLGRPLNSSNDDSDPIISPQGHYLIFGNNYNDLYVTFNQGNRAWSEPVNLNEFCPGINTGGHQEYAPFMTADGRYLFFNRYGVGIHWVENSLPQPDPNGTVTNCMTGNHFKSIQDALVYAQPGDTIEIKPGIYQESLVLDRDVTLTSIDPNDPYYIGGTIIQGDPNDPVITLIQNTDACCLAGLTFRSGSIGIQGTDTQAILYHCRIMDHQSHGIELSDQSHPHLVHCLISANGGSGIVMNPTQGPRPRHCQPTLEDCVIVQNTAGGLVDGEPEIIDCILE